MILEFEKDTDLIHTSASIKESTIIEPVFIGPGVQITNSVIGPHVSIGANTKVNDSRISRSIVRNDSAIINAVIENSLIGTNTQIKLSANDLSLGDYSTLA